MSRWAAGLREMLALKGETPPTVGVYSSATANDMILDEVLKLYTEI